MHDHTEDSLRLLLSHVDDLCRRARGGAVVWSDFLTMREQIEIDRHLGTSGRKSTLFWGGFEGAERKMLFILPDYLTDTLEAVSAIPLRELGLQELAPYLGESYAEAYAVLHIKGSGYHTLEHRALMGSLLALGVERAVVGDIVVLDPHLALVACKRSMADFLVSEWKMVGGDTVRVEAITLPQEFCVERKFQLIRETIASERLDCVLAALTNLSREKAQNMIRAGLVDVDFIKEQRPDRTVPTGAMLSVRGYGRYQVEGTDGMTKKGRLRLVAKKFV